MKMSGIHSKKASPLPGELEDRIVAHYIRLEVSVKPDVIKEHGTKVFLYRYG
jgi:hypothetical protein